VNQRIAALEHQVSDLKDKVNFFVRTSLPPVEGIFFDGQIFDAYRFVSDLIRKAKRSVVLIDNYVDDTVLSLMDKRQEGVTAIVYTKSVSEQLQLDITRHNEQYATSDDSKVQFVGTYAPVMLTGNNTANLYMGTDDKIHIPTEHSEVGAFNGYFLLDLGSGLGKPGTDHLQKIVMNISGADDVLRVITITVPQKMEDGVWYDLQGRKYTGQPTQHGIYIVNGKKILIK